MRGQSAIEFLITYSWAILILALFIVAVLLISNTGTPSVYIQSTCTIQPLLPCSGSSLEYNSPAPLTYYLIFANQLGSIIYFPNNALTITRSSVGTVANSQGECSPEYAINGAYVLCSAQLGGNAKPRAGTQESTFFTLSYMICTAANSVTACGNSVYKSSGYSTQAVYGQSASIYYVTFNAIGGTIVMDGVDFFNGTSAYFPPGNYIIFAQPAIGNAFTGWSVTSGQLNSTTSQEASLIINSNDIITANFN